MVIELPLLQPSLFYIAETVTARCWLWKKKVEAGYHCNRVYSTVRTSCCAVCASVNWGFRWSQVHFHICSAWVQWGSLALAKTTCSPLSNTSSGLVCFSWSSRWYGMLQRPPSVSVFSLWLQLLRWNFRKCQIQPGLCMIMKDAIPTTEKGKNCHNRSAESLERPREAAVWLTLKLSCCRSPLFCLT